MKEKILWICYLKYNSWVGYRPISRFLNFKLWPEYENNLRVLITIPEIEIEHKLHPESEPESEIKYFVSNHHPWSFIFKLWSIFFVFSERYIAAPCATQGDPQYLAASVPSKVPLFGSFIYIFCSTNEHV